MTEEEKDFCKVDQFLSEKCKDLGNISEFLNLHFLGYLMN
jgi:hypothetical protein